SQIYTSSSITFEITANEDVALAAYVLDGAILPVLMNAVSTTNFTATVSLTDGNHSVTFYATDLAGNIGTSTTINFVVDTSGAGDTTAPVVTIISPTNNQTYSTRTITVDFTAVDLNLNTCYYSLNGAANVTTACNTPFTITALNGTNTLTVYAADNSGNVGSQTITFNVDTSAGKSRNSGARVVSDSDGTKQYLSQFEPSATTEDEEVLGAVSQPSSSAGFWAWLLITGVLILAVAVIIVWLRR
ncbi:MAG: Ig-like domain-containing protein, partial [archaeon]